MIQRRSAYRITIVATPCLTVRRPLSSKAIFIRFYFEEFSFLLIMDLKSDGHSVQVYQYTPNGPAAYIFVAAFGAAAAGHAVETVRLRAPYLIPLVIRCISKDAFLKFHKIF